MPRLSAGNILRADTGSTGPFGASGKGAVLVIRVETDGSLLCLPIVQEALSEGLSWHHPVGPADLTEGDLPEGLSIDSSKPLLLPEAAAGVRQAAVGRNLLDRVTRSFVKWSSLAHYDLFHAGRPLSYVPAAGKVLDERELFAMIDASLDMWLTAGRFNDEFEKRIAAFLGVRYALTVNSGSSANLLAVSTLTSPKLGDRRLRRGDEVITVAAGFPTTVSPLIQNGLVPVFVDVDLGTYNITVSQISRALSERTKAVMVAHTLGNPFDVDGVLEICRKHGLWLIEDNCDALGSRYDGACTGSFGHLATLSFYPAHHMTMGEGGAVVTNDPELFRIAVSLRDWGKDCWCPTGRDDTCGRRFTQRHGNLPEGYDHKFVFSHLGYNLKITDWQAALALAQIEKLPSFVEKRKENFRLLSAGLAPLTEHLLLPEATDRSDPSWFGFPVTLRNHPRIGKTECVRYLEERGIGTRQVFAGNMLRQPAFLTGDVGLRVVDSPLVGADDLTEEHYGLIPNTDTVMRNTFWVGVWPGITPEWIGHVCDAFRTFLAERC